MSKNLPVTVAALLAATTMGLATLTGGAVAPPTSDVAIATASVAAAEATDEDIAAAIDGFEADGVEPVAVEIVDASVVATYAIGDGSLLGLAEPAVDSRLDETYDAEVVDVPTASGQSRPLPSVSLGRNGYGFYVQFSHQDQLAIKSGGVAAALALIAPLCGACAVIGGIAAAVAAPYILSNGFCPGTQYMRFYYDLAGNVQRQTCGRP